MPEMNTSRSVQFAPERMVQSVDDCYFYHTMELPGLGLIQGEWDLRGRFPDYTGHVDFAGKSVLDIGTASGFLSFEAEQRGAEVVSFDIGHGGLQHLLPFRQNLYYQDHQRWAEEQTQGFERWKNAYWLGHRLLRSRARAFYGDVYELPAGLGRFDVVMVGSVLEHLRDPISALASISRVSGHTIVIVTPMLETDEPIARLQGRADSPQLDYTWWIYSLGTYREVLSMLGYRIASVKTGTYKFVKSKELAQRTTIVASHEE